MTSLIVRAIYYFAGLDALEMINTYRVDVTGPRRTRSGEASMIVQADEKRGRPAKVPVR